MSFKVLKETSSSMARIGVIATRHGEIETPRLYAGCNARRDTYAAPRDLESLGLQALSRIPCISILNRVQI